MFIHGLSLAELSLNETLAQKKTGRESEKGRRNFCSSRRGSRFTNREGLKNPFSSSSSSFESETRLEKAMPGRFGEVRYSENPVTAITGLEERRRGEN